MFRTLNAFDNKEGAMGGFDPLPFKLVGIIFRLLRTSKSSLNFIKIS